MMAYRSRNCRPRKPVKCCNGDCRQGRDCPRRTPTVSLWPLALWLVACCWSAAMALANVIR